MRIGEFMVMAAGKALSAILPRDEGLCAAGSWLGEMYGDNPKYFVEWLLGHTDMRIVWVGKAKMEKQLPAHPNLRFARLGSAKALWSALRAKTWLVSQGTMDIAPASFRGRATLINLWHGLAFKNSGMTRSDGEVKKARHKPLKTRIVNALTRREGDELGWTSVASSEGGVHLSEALPQLFSRKLMVEFGTPRNDYLIANRDNGALRKALRRKYGAIMGIPEGKKMVLYLPTFRKEREKMFRFGELEGEEKAALEKALEAIGAVWVEKPHALTGLSGEGILTQELLLIADILVTDYSSAFIDFGLLGRKTVHFVYDYEEYTKRDAGLAYNLEEVAGGALAKTVKELADALQGESRPGPKFASLVEFEKGDACRRLAERFFGGHLTK